MEPQGQFIPPFSLRPTSTRGWKGHLAEQGVPLIEEITRDTGRSVYFRDPAGNLLEIMDADPWPS
jgi:catechol 2,3-dioxygenase-like lactoylglutathione lyase family enzyme